MASAITEAADLRVSFESFLTRPDDDRRAEWVDGRIDYRMPASLAHQLLCKILLAILDLFVSKNDLGTVLVSPFLMRLTLRPSGREPDLLIVSTENQQHLRNTYLDGPADLAVEIVSPESRERDRAEKFDEYAAAGVSEYWIIDTELRIAEFYVLRDGAYRPARIDVDGRFWSVVLPGFWIDVSAIWDEQGLRDSLDDWQRFFLERNAPAE